MKFGCQEDFLARRRGEISIVILVIGVFVVCTLALLTFFSSSTYVKDSFVGVGFLGKLNSQVEMNSVDSNFPIDTSIGSNGQKVFYQEDIRREGFLWSKEKLVFSIEYPLR